MITIVEIKIIKGIPCIVLDGEKKKKKSYLECEFVKKPLQGDEKKSISYAKCDFTSILRFKESRAQYELLTEIKERFRHQRRKKN